MVSQHQGKTTGAAQMSAPLPWGMPPGQGGSVRWTSYCPSRRTPAVRPRARRGWVRRDRPTADHGRKRTAFLCLYVGSVGRNFGGRRTFVACSKAKANLIKVGSLNARPMNVMPTGRPKGSPAGTVTSG
jgi:hypothetical protein